MKNLIFSSVLVLIASSAAPAQQAVQWRVEDGGNLHEYRVVTTQLSWAQTQQLSQAAGEYLATVTSTAEPDVVWSVASVFPQASTMTAS